MLGLSYSVRVTLVRFVNALALRRVRQPHSRRLVVTTADAAVFKALALTFHNAPTGRCDPGMVAIAEAAGVALSTVHEAIERLRAAGLLTYYRRFARLPSGYRRWTHAYRIKTHSRSLSEFGGKPESPKNPKGGLRSGGAKALQWLHGSDKKSRPPSLRSPDPIWVVEERERLRRAAFGLGASGVARPAERPSAGFLGGFPGGVPGSGSR